LRLLAEETAEMREHDHDHEHEHHHHDHDDHDHDHEHHHDHDDHDHEHEHHHDHDEHDHEHEHHHDHEHGEEECSCGCGHPHDHGHHHADDVFTSWGAETARSYSKEEIEHILEQLLKESEYGMVLRAKGIVRGSDGQWIHFDYVPGEPDVRTGGAEITGRFCVIGSGLNEQKLAELFSA
ncbi:MAG: cobalamin biosynthesis protein CobW, partial [Clostridia bacterium]|nr:cobalamin biosynthesis protein CobW [Clostridia bacterium]